MAKYIIDIASPNVRNEYIVYWTYDGLEAKRVSDLTPYTDPDLEQVRKEAYNNGRRDGLKVGYENLKAVECERIDKAYKRGLNDAWEAVRKVTQVRKYGGYGDCLEEVFGRHRVPWDVFDYSASEAIDKIRAYEQEKEEQIQVGDEVKNTQTDARFIVTHMWVNNHGEKGVSGFNYECSAFSTALDLVRKTGRHFPEIAEVLRKMKES